MNPRQDRLTISYEYDIDTPKSERAYVVPEHLFKRMKTRLTNKISMLSVCQNIGSVFLGIAGSALIAIFTIENLNQYCGIIFWISLIIGMLCWIFSFIFGKMEDDNNKELLNDLSLLEQRDSL